MTVTLDRRAVRRQDRHGVDSVLETLPVLTTPERLWDKAIELGRRCVDRGFHAGPMNLLIAALAIHHGAELVTFDRDYASIAGASTLRLQLLKRAA